MDCWDTDPERAAMATARAGIRDLDRRLGAWLANLQAHPGSLLDLAELTPPQRDLLALVYNNLQAIYHQRRSYACPVERFVRDRAAPIDAAGVLACDRHAATALVDARAFVCYRNWTTLRDDLGTTFRPHSKQVRDLMQVFEAWTGFDDSLRLCEPVAVTPGGRVAVVFREFVDVAHYRRCVVYWGTDLRHRRQLCRPRMGCARCYPCVPTALLSLVDSDNPAFCLAAPRFSNGDQADELPMPMWWPPPSVLSTRYCDPLPLAQRQQAITWFFSGIEAPMTRLFAVAAALGTDVGHALALIEETAVRDFRAFRGHPHEALHRQQHFIAPHLRDGLLYSIVAGDIVRAGGTAK